MGSLSSGVLRRLVLTAAVLMVAAASAAADTTVKWLHIEVNPAQVKIWEEVARAYEAAHPGVKVEMQFLENEAYKAKLPTILQSKDRPHIIYSWAGGVLKAQIEAGVLEDITDQVKGYSDTIAPAALAAFSQSGHVYGLPISLSQVGFLYNKDLMAKGNVDASKIKTWDDLLAAVKPSRGLGLDLSPVAVDLEDVRRVFCQPRIDIDVDLGAGDAGGHAWGCDLTDGYVRINADYTT